MAVCHFYGKLTILCRSINYHKIYTLFLWVICTSLKIYNICRMSFVCNVCDIVFHLINLVPFELLEDCCLSII